MQPASIKGNWEECIILDGNLEIFLRCFENLWLCFGDCAGCTEFEDNDNFFNTGIIFPTALKRSRVNGAELRLVIPRLQRFSGSLSITHFHVVVDPPFTGGLFLGSTAIDLLTAGPFVIDHDQKLGAHGFLRYDISKAFWVSTAVRYDSGLVSNPSDPEEVAKDPDYSDLLPYVNLGSDPPRVNSRYIVDAAVGYHNMLEGRLRWDIQFQATNLTNTFWWDSSAPPTNVSDTAVRNEVIKYFTNGGGSPDASTVYSVFLPSGSYSSYGSSTSCGGPNLQYCAYHSNFNYNGTNVKYASLPYPG